ncbi:MAG: hypothetical protein ACRDYD_07215 [Acidimicrobiales bacterium]
MASRSPFRFVLSGLPLIAAGAALSACSMGGGAACSPAMSFRGHEYLPMEVGKQYALAYVPPSHVHPLGTGTEPRCNDTGPIDLTAGGPTTVRVARIDTVPSAVAVAVSPHDMVWVAKEAPDPRSLEAEPWLTTSPST